MAIRKVQINNLVKGALFGFLVVTLAFFTMGCSKDKGSAGTRTGGFPGGPFPGGGFPGGGIGGNWVGSALGDDSTGTFQLGLDFFSDGSFNPGGASSVTAQGYLYLPQGMGCGFMGGGMNAGFWSVQSVQPGFLQTDLVQNLQLEAFNQNTGGRATLHITYGRIFTINPKEVACGGSGGSHYDELAASVSIYVNGVGCGAKYIEVQNHPNSCR